MAYTSENGYKYLFPTLDNDAASISEQPASVSAIAPQSLWSTATQSVSDTALGMAEETLNADISERISRTNIRRRAHDTASGDDGSLSIIQRFHSNLIMQYLRDERGMAQSPETKPWMKAPEVPTAREIFDQNEEWTRLDENEDVILDGNTLNGAWEETIDFPPIENYLQAHHGMLREEAVLPLRGAIRRLQEIPYASEEAARSNSIGIYSKVYVTTLTFSTRGIGVRVVFSLNQVGKQIRWRQSNRLKTGSLVVLSPANDMFRTAEKCIVATIAARPIDMLEENPHKIDLFIARLENIPIDPSVEYNMIEDRTSYFESVRHTMLSLQKMNTEAFPLANHIVTVDSRVKPPRYITKNAYLDLRDVFTSTSDIPDRFLSVDVLREWPRASDACLDASQLKALHHILQKCVAIVQGPPGTGKTYVSVTALRVLMANMQPTDPPIIVACQTNHALDQLLNHVAAFEQSFIRLGGRSKDVGIVKSRTLFNVKQAEKSTAPNRMRQRAFAISRDLEEQMIRVLEPLNHKLDPSSGLIDHTRLFHLGVLNRTQCQSLERGDPRWASVHHEQESPLVEWLGKNLIHNDRNAHFKPELYTFPFEAEDLEVEQLREIEAENFCQDDDQDFESLKGNATTIWDAFSGKKAAVSNHEITQLLKDHEQDMWEIPARYRGAVFNHLIGKAKDAIQKNFARLAEKYHQNAQDLRYRHWEHDAIILRQQKLIGVTTTGLSKNRGLIAGLSPKILMIEEAAETMEPPVTAGCVPTIEHLILIGDHKQLRPQCGVKSLETGPFNLNVSLFERLVSNNLPYKMLKRQRRMVPEIRRLLTPIYDNEINDHEIVRDSTIRKPITGMGGINSLFFTHDWPEACDDQMSATNLREAEMVVGMFDYLISNGMTPEQITVLTFYNGQRKMILRLLRQHTRIGQDSRRIFKVVTVDSYQGEENDIVLLSLVRSNERGQVGFLNVENRICVALSRAKCGLYMFGNAELLVGESKLWANVVDILLEDFPSRLVWHMPLKCTKHDRKMYIQNPENWNEIDGGCSHDCGVIKECKHQCTLKCHPFGHEKVPCGEKCIRILACGHKCVRKCLEACVCRVCGKTAAAEAIGSAKEAWKDFAKSNQDRSGLNYHVVGEKLGHFLDEQLEGSGLGQQVKESLQSVAQVQKPATGCDKPAKENLPLQVLADEEENLIDLDIEENFQLPMQVDEEVTGVERHTKEASQTQAPAAGEENLIDLT